MNPIISNISKSIEIWEKEGKLIFLGDPYHGANSLQFLERIYNNILPNKFVDVVFLEGVPYNDGLNWATLTSNSLLLVNIAKQFSNNIYGLETTYTDPVKNKTEFYNIRCTKCLDIWPEIIKEHRSNRLNIVLVGTSHLVPIKENGVIVKSIDNDFYNTYTFSVVDLEESMEKKKLENMTPENAVKHYIKHGITYRPQGGSKSVRVLIDPWPEIPIFDVD
tara:strand:- start:260 stop:919 length:660 start_codon:yes stop_codon:yes gene_type:complete